MSSLYTRPNSKTFQVALTVKGERLFGTLATPDRKEAQKRADALQTVVDALSAPEKRTQKALLKLVEAVFAVANVPAPWDEKERRQIPLRDIADVYLDKRPKASVALECFFGYLTGGDKRSIQSVTASDVQNWYDSINDFLATETSKKRLSSLFNFFHYAFRMGYIHVNPCGMVERIKDKAVIDRLPMSDEDFEKLRQFLVSSSMRDSGSWLTMIHLSRYAGLRLMDAVNLPTSAIQDGILIYTARKTGESHCVPVLPPLAKYLSIAGVSEGVHFCPMLIGRKQSNLSGRFGELMDMAGIKVPTVESNGRTIRRCTAHSLRHAFVTWLAKSGVPRDVAKQLSGHASNASHAVYLHESGREIAENVRKYFTSTPTQS